MAFANGQVQSPAAAPLVSTGSSDWLDLFLAYTEGIPTPEHFRLWSGITAVAGALERRVWAVTRRGALYPNLYTLLVGVPAVGKTEAVKPAVELWKATRKLYVAPDDVTKASLVDALAKASRKMLIGGKLLEYNTLLVQSDELGVLMSSYDLNFMSVLTKLYDNGSAYQETRRTREAQLDIVNPQVTLLAGSQPSFMTSFFPDEAWDQGFTSRLIMVYAADRPYVDLFGDEDPREKQRETLLRELSRLTQLYGRFTWEPGAKAELSAWDQAGGPPTPEHPKLLHYCKRRTVHLVKLCMVSSASRGNDLLVTSWDLDRARQWLLAAEVNMPEIFHAMSGKSDSRVLDELHQFVWRLYGSTQKPIGRAAIVNFLKRFAPVDKVFRILYVAESSNMLDRVAGTENYIPRPKAKHGLE